MKTNLEVCYYLVHNKGSLLVYAPHIEEDLEQLVDPRVYSCNVDRFFESNPAIALATVRDRVVGIGMVDRAEEGFCYAHDIAVVSLFRRNGIGTKIMEMLFFSGRFFFGAEYMQLGCEQGNKGGRTFYEHLGFARTGAGLAPGQDMLTVDVSIR